MNSDFQQRKSCRSRAAFSLLEMIIVLGIIVMFVSFFALRFNDSESEELINEASRELKTIAAKAKRRSFAYRRDQFVVFHRNTILLTESVLPRDWDTGNSIANYSFPKGVTVDCRTEFSDLKYRGINGVIWVFRGSGLNDPIEIRLSHNGSFNALRFNLLTGRAEEQSIFR